MVLTAHAEKSLEKKTPRAAAGVAIAATARERGGAASSDSRKGDGKADGDNGRNIDRKWPPQPRNDKYRDNH